MQKLWSFRNFKVPDRFRNTEAKRVAISDGVPTILFICSHYKPSETIKLFIGSNAPNLVWFPKLKGIARRT